jgi:hypothetical protein
LGLTRVQVIRKKRAQGVRHTGRDIQNRELRDGAISTQGENLPTGQYSGGKGQGQELPTGRDGVEAEVEWFTVR